MKSEKIKRSSNKEKEAMMKFVYEFSTEYSQSELLLMSYSELKSIIKTIIMKW